jgi:tetratricopeptide (TPR) repeat protein
LLLSKKAAGEDGMAQQTTARLSQPARSIERALKLHREGRLDEADRIYGAVLAADPHHFDALHLSGVLKHQQGRSVDALRLVAAALKAKPGSADALMNYGMILDALDRHEEALASFDRLLAMGAGDAILHYNRGNVLNNIGRYADALASYDAALALAPDHADALYNRGNILRSLGRIEDALASYDDALSLAPDRADIRNNRSALLMAFERADEALESLDKVLASNPDDIAALNNRGNALLHLKRYDEAITSYDKVLALCPDHAEALSNRGLALAELGHYDEALAHYAQALHIAPDFVDAHINRGNALTKLTRMEEALRSYSDALALSPQHPEANFDEALTRLCMGDFREGWRQYEYRWKRKNAAAHRPDFPRPLWRGEKELHGKTIFLPAEQGLGDAIQFARYVPLVAALGANVLLGVHRPLTALMASVPGVSQVIADGETLPAFDLYCPLLSLPLAFETELATIPSSVPYIRPQEERIAKWRDRLPASGHLRIGICWAGNSGYENDRNRSIPLERFAALLAVSGVDFVSVQKEVNEAQAAILREHGVIQLGQEFEDFADTAAVVAMLDLVIAVDTSVAHLAGAMAKAVALLLPFSPDWRWMLDRTDSPWYPTMRLFRQTAIGDWDGPLERVRKELADVARRPAGPR